MCRALLGATLSQLSKKSVRALHANTNLETFCSTKCSFTPGWLCKAPVLGESLNKPPGFCSRVTSDLALFLTNTISIIRASLGGGGRGTRNISHHTKHKQAPKSLWCTSKWQSCTAEELAVLSVKNYPAHAMQGKPEIRVSFSPATIQASRKRQKIKGALARKESRKSPVHHLMQHEASRVAKPWVAARLGSDIQ